ncbi:patatin-like phospholipase family protein [Paenibacillus sp. GCM10012307]|uniref:Patatin-like phospholipase family protein n=1 Tax=Paenibacillus roseus TaxID=2798579 RepID=A0A934JCG4_9BACL|nr:patatin-like phospholipase family protein [Paenibacillus roseus]MBJ6364258.1 patatin-like phospholipase family protein [Paenibacillus roseus]
MKINAVFEGGGMKGISLVGAVYVMQQRGFDFHHVAGTSSGGIVASLLAAGYTAEQMKPIIQSTSFASLMKRSAIFNVKFIGSAVRLLLRKGLYSGDALEEWIWNLLRSRGVYTFADLPPNKLKLIASDITNGKLLVLPDDIAYYGIQPSRLEVAKAVRMSASIPYFFDPVTIKDKEFNSRIKGLRLHRRSAYIVDGGLLSNFPLWLFDEKNEPHKAARLPVVGFQMVGKNDTEPRTIRGPVSMFQAMMETMMLAHDQRYIEKDDWERTIKIPTLGIRTTQFHLSPDMSEKLFASGVAAAEKFLKTSR